MLPLGQEATSSMPSAMLGAGFRAMVSRNAAAGSSSECATRPITVPRGADTMPLKSANFMSSATPNSTNARITSSAINDSGVKFSRIASMPLTPLTCRSAPGACP